MGFYLINIGLIVGVVVLLGLVTMGLWWLFVLWSLPQVKSLYERLGLPEPDAEEQWVANYSLEMQAAADRMRKSTVAKVIVYLNMATTVAALVPVGFAIYNLVTNNQRQALNFNLAALATLVVTKGGLFLLTVVLIPAAKSIPPAIAGGYAWKKVNEWMDARKKEKPPTT